MTSSNLVGYRKVGGLFTLEDTARIHPNKPIGVVDARTITHQSAILDKIAREVDRRKLLTRSQGDELIAPALQERIVSHKDAGHFMLDHGCECPFEITKDWSE